MNPATLILVANGVAAIAGSLNQWAALFTKVKAMVDAGQEPDLASLTRITSQLQDQQAQMGRLLIDLEQLSAGADPS